MGDIEPLTRVQQLRLLRIAREAIRSQLIRGTLPAPEREEPALAEPRGAFVSLHLDDGLRGCIGQLYADAPLHRAVAEMAVAAATADPRFAPLTSSELREADIEISVLGPLLPIAAGDVSVGVHGLYVARGPRRGVLLPQVASDYGWGRERLLDETCRKAGLPTGAWREPETRLEAFTAQVFSDSGMLDA